MQVLRLPLALFLLAGATLAGDVLAPPSEEAEGPEPRLGRFDVRGRTARLTGDFFERLSGSEELPAAGERWTFRPFEGVALELVVDAAYPGLTGGAVVYGHVEDEPGGSFALARVGSSVHLNAYDAAGRGFGLRHVEGGWHSVVETVPQELEGCGTDGPGVRVPPDAPAPQAGYAGGTVHDFDVMIAYSPGALALAGSHSAMVAAIEVALAQGNQALANSLADGPFTAHYDLVATHYADWHSDGNSFSWQVSFLKGFGDGYLDEIHHLRTLAGADFVGLLIDDSNESYCGMANMMDYSFLNNDADGSKAFSVTRYSCASTGFTLPHELGHNLGCAHNPEDVDVEGVFTNSKGHRWTGSTGFNYRSVMAYSPGIQVPHYSNPGIDHLGAPTGLSTRDNVATIEFTGNAAEDFLNPSLKHSDVWVDLTLGPFDPSGNGTSTFPYHSVKEGVLKVANFGTIHVRGPGTGVLPWLERICRVEVESGAPVTMVEGP